MNPRLLLFGLAAAVAVGAWVTTCAAWQLTRVRDRVAPLDSAHFERLTLVTLGTGDAHENPARRGPASALGLGDRVVLVDAGRAVADALRLAQIPVTQPDTVFLTSLLPENTVGLDDLLFVGWLSGREEPLRVVGPRGTAALARALEAAHAPAIAARAAETGLVAAGARLQVLEIGDGWREPSEDWSVKAGALPGGPVEALAYRFEAGGRSAVIAGTGWAPEALTAFASGAHLLSHEAIFPFTDELATRLGIEAALADRLERETALHTSIEAVGGIARRAGVETLVLVRLRPPPVYDLQLTGIVGRSFDGDIVIAEDGDRIHP